MVEEMEEESLEKKSRHDGDDIDDEITAVF